ncbi:Uncharacterised protein [Shigella sonnei]|nr:Uncharacterised protein [Shigella sonnei]
MCMSFSKMVPIRTGRVRGCWSTSTRYRVSCLRESAPSWDQMPRVLAGSMNMHWWIAAVSTIWPIYAHCRTGFSNMS